MITIPTIVKRYFLKHKSGAGFTLVELIIVVSIVTLIAAVALANFLSFRGRLSLDREAGKVALAVRSAQQFSTGVRRFEGETFIEGTEPPLCGDIFKAQFPAYAVSIDTDNQREYQIVADPDCDQVSGNYPNDGIQTILLENNISIEDVCINVDSASPECGVSTLDAWFIRPAPAVLFTVDGVPDSDVASAKIILGFIDGSKKSVIIRTTGQVSIQNEN